VVVVSGLPRSGTSMAMKMLAAGGLALITDGQRTADEDNPRGYFEDERVKDLARVPDRTWVRDARGKGIKVVTSLLRYLPADNFYKVVLMRRDLEEVLSSQRKMLERRGEPDATPDERMRELWEDDIWRAHYVLKHRSNVDWIEIEYREVVGDPVGQARRLAEFVGGLDVEKMSAAVDRQLYRNRAEA
jgi:hypothetical protein